MRVGASYRAHARQSHRTRARYCRPYQHRNGCAFSRGNRMIVPPMPSSIETWVKIALAVDAIDVVAKATAKVFKSSSHGAKGKYLHPA